MKKDNKDSDSDDVSEASKQINTDNSPKFIPVAKLQTKPKSKKITINISDTQYPIIEQIAEQLGWIIQRSEGLGDWDVWWTDREIQSNTLFRMNLHQKINHFPGIYVLARKNLLGSNLMAMKSYFPNEYNFFPQTWTIPSQFSQFRQYYENIEKGHTRTYIVKPQALSQGRGIFLTRNIEDILNGNKYVIQRYLKNPLLLDKLKFDLRIYVLLAGTDPLRLYIYHEGLTRFATQEYQEPNNDNLAKSYIHLTNYSLNKANPKYIYNTSDKDMDKGHKRTLSSTYQRLRKDGVDVDKLKLQIQDIIIKTVISGLPSIRHQYQYCQPEQYEGMMCFHILGFDVMITDNLKPIIIEVNHTPSFETGTPLDYLVKKNLVKDTLKLMRINQKNKKKNYQKAKQLAKIRLETGKRDILKGKQRNQLIKKTQNERNQVEKNILGGYKRIYPPENILEQAKYQKFYQYALKISKEQNQIRKHIVGEKKLEPRSLNKKQLKSRNGFQKQCKQNYNTIESTKVRDSKLNIWNINLSDEIQVKQAQEQILSLSQNKVAVQNVIEDSSIRISYNTDINKKIDNERISFRTKINKRISPSNCNHQIIKCTQSIKKFNELIAKYVISREASLHNHACQQKQLSSQSSAVKGRHKMIVSRQRMNSSKKQSRRYFNNINEVRFQINHGQFIKPKSYLIAHEKQSFGLKSIQTNNHHILKPQTANQIKDYLMNGIIVSKPISHFYWNNNKSTKKVSSKKYAFAQK